MKRWLWIWVVFAPVATGAGACDEPLAVYETRSYAECNVMAHRLNEEEHRHWPQNYSCDWR